MFRATQSASAAWFRNAARGSVSALMARGSYVAIVCMLLAIASAAVLAHVEPPRPTAELLFSAAGERLTVTAHLPIAALSDVNFPRDPDGRIVRADLEQPLQIVARQVASSLELEQDGAFLPQPATRASLQPDEALVDVELDYVIRRGGRNLTARVQAFRAGFDVVPTVARFAGSSGITRTYQVAGAAERVNFDPDAPRALAHFVGRGVRALSDDWDFVLFAVCLLVPIRAAGPRRSSTMALLAGEAAAASVTAALWPALPPGTVPVMSTIAASTIVIAALQAIVSPASQWLGPLALLFGLANGVAIGQMFRDAMPFAGSHVVLSFGALVATILLGQLWIMALLSSATALLYRLGVPERIAIVGTAVYVCHEGLDSIVERTTMVAQTAAMNLEHLLTGLTLVWALIVLLAGLLSAFRGGGSGAPMLPDSASAQP